MNTTTHLVHTIQPLRNMDSASSHPRRHESLPTRKQPNTNKHVFRRHSLVTLRHGLRVLDDASCIDEHLPRESIHSTISDAPSHTCKGCQVNQTNVELQCGHILFCMECAVIMMRASQACPYCGEGIARFHIISEELDNQVDSYSRQCDEEPAKLAQDCDDLCVINLNRRLSFTIGAPSDTNIRAENLKRRRRGSESSLSDSVSTSSSTHSDNSTARRGFRRSIMQALRFKPRALKKPKQAAETCVTAVKCLHVGSKSLPGSKYLYPFYCLFSVLCLPCAVRYAANHD